MRSLLSFFFAAFVLWISPRFWLKPKGGRSEIRRVGLRFAVPQTRPWAPSSIPSFANLDQHEAPNVPRPGPPEGRGAPLK